MKNLKSWYNTFLMPVISVTLLFTFLLAPFQSATANNNEINQPIPYLQKGMYVIVGVFQIPENAAQYAKSIRINGKSPNIGKIEKTRLFYVYAYKTKDDLEFAREKRAELRATKKYYDAWIKYVGLNLEDLLKKDSEIEQELTVAENTKEIKSAEINVPVEEEFIPPPPVQKDQNLYNYRFNVINATTSKEVSGYITIIDAARNKAMKSVSTNQIHQIEAPKSQSKEIIAICDVFGYVKEQAKFKIDDPASSSDKSMISESGGITTVKYELARHKVGDILTMYHVYFYTNAAIMKPESKFELNSLLAMLKENEKLEIKIHGHTNGNAAGKIIMLKEDDSTFFKVTSNNTESVSSAKELSKVRAEVIMRWLAENGIDKKRMDLKGWGGKKMIYKKTDSMAGKNVRVEIEILKG